MNIHKDARLTPLRREAMAHAVVKAVFPKTMPRWVARFRAEGGKGMADRSSRPGRSPKRYPNVTDKTVVDRIVTLRRQRFTGGHIALEIGVSPATVSRVLKRAGLSRLKQLEPAEPIRRYDGTIPAR